MKNILERVGNHWKRSTVKKAARKWIGLICCASMLAGTCSAALPGQAVEKKTVCGKEEHEHTSECYTRELVCGQEESEGHQHTDECYEDVLTCGKEVHVHTEDCYAQEEADEKDGGETADAAVTEDASTEEAAEKASNEKNADDGAEESQTGAEDEEAVEGEASQPASDAPGNDGKDDAADTDGTAADENADKKDPAADQTKTADDAASKSGKDAGEAKEAKPEKLEPLAFDELLTDKTGIYYLKEDGDADDPDDWERLTDDTVLEPEEHVILHIAYEIPAGKLNPTNAEAEYVLPLGIDMSEDEVRRVKEKDHTLYEGTDRTADDNKETGEFTIEEETNDKGDVTERRLVIRFNEYAQKKAGGVKLADGTEKQAPEKLEGYLEITVSAEDLLALEKVEEKEPEENEAGYREYKLEWNDDSDLDTYITFNWEQPEDRHNDKAEEEEKKYYAGSLTFKGSDYAVTADFDESAKLPEGTSLKVSELQGAEYDNYLEEAQKAVEDGKEVKGARFFDITFVDEDGAPIEPAGMVDIRIRYRSSKKIDEDTSVEGLHFTEEGTEPVEVETNGASKNLVKEVTFQSDSFSVFGVLYTVDFHYNGVDYSIPGNTQILLTQLIETMHITVPDNDKNADNDPLLDINDVASVEFTDRHLVQVDQVSGLITINSVDGSLADVDAGAYNFLLSSRKPFSTEEMLTVTLKDGKEIKVGVTDKKEFVVELEIGDGVTLDRNYKIGLHYNSGWPKKLPCTQDQNIYTFDLEEWENPDQIGLFYGDKLIENGDAVNGNMVDITMSKEGNSIKLTKPVDFKIKTEFFESDGTTHPSNVPGDYYLLIKMVRDSGTYYALQRVDGSTNPSSLSAPIIFKKYYLEWGQLILGADSYYTGVETISTQVVTGVNGTDDNNLKRAIEGGNGVVKYNENVIDGTQSRDLTKDLYSSSSAIVEGDDGNYAMTTTFVRQKNDGVDHEITVNFYTEKHAYPGNPEKLEKNPGLDTAAGAYYFVVRLYNEGKLVAYKVKAADIGEANSTGTFTTTIVADETFTIVDDKGIDIEGSNHVKYDPTMYTSKVRLYKANNANALPQKLAEVGEFGTDVLPGYDFMYNKDWTSDETLKTVEGDKIIKTATSLGLYKANKKKYQVKVVVEDGTELVADDQLKLYVQAAHETTNIDKFGEANILDNAEVSEEAGKRVYTILIEDQTQNPIFQKWTNLGEGGNTISGNETFDLYVKQKSRKLESGTPILLNNGTAASLSGYEVTYDTDTLDENGIFLDKNVTTENGVTTITHYVYIKKVTYDSAVGPADVLGGASEYGVVADRYEQSGHTETNYAVHELSQSTNSSVNGAGNKGDIPFYVGKIDEGTKVWVETNTETNNVNIYYFMTEEDKEDKIANEFQDRIVNNPTRYHIITMPKDEIDGIVTDLINEGAIKSQELRDKAATVAPIASQNDNTVLDTRMYPDGITIYVDCAGILDKMCATGWKINKLENQSIVFNIPGTDVTLAKMEANIYNGKNPDEKLRCTTTDTSDFNNSNSESDAAKKWDQDIMRHITFNAYEAKTLDMDTVSGAILAPYATKVTQKNGAGTIVTGGTFVSPSEWHYYYQGRSWSYEEPQTGNLNIQKCVEGETPRTGYSDTEFKFEVTFKNPDGSPFTGAVKLKDLNHYDGENPVSVNVKNDGTLKVVVTERKEFIAKISEIPVGTEYEVKEIDLPDGWKQTDITPGDGEPINYSGTTSRVIEKGVTKTAIGYNVYEATGTAEFSGTKTIVGRNFKEGDEFTVSVSGKNGATLPMPGKKRELGTSYTKTFSLTKNDTGNTFPYVLDKIHYSVEDIPTNQLSNTFTYVVTESAQDMEGVTTLAKESYEVDVTISDNGDGTLDVKMSPNYNSLNFTNKTETTDFEFSKIWKDTSSNPVEWPENTVIEVTLYSTTGGTNDNTVDTFTLTAAGGIGAVTGYKFTGKNADKTYTFSITGLPATNAGGQELTYYVKEAPVEGYKAPEYGVSQRAGGDDVETMTVVSKNENADRAENHQYITNRPEDAVTLPSAGGIGTTLFYIVGSILVIGAAVVLITRRRMNDQ